MIIPDEEIQNARAKWTISGTIRQDNGLQLRIVSNVPPLPEAIEATPTLEDAYLYIRMKQGEV
ncbi:hypothetical protein D3C76_1849550 [compost metagenome]